MYCALGLGCGFAFPSSDYTTGLDPRSHARARSRLSLDPKQRASRLEACLVRPQVHCESDISCQGLDPTSRRLWAHAKQPSNSLGLLFTPNLTWWPGYSDTRTTSRCCSRSRLTKDGRCSEPSLQESVWNELRSTFAYTIGFGFRLFFLTSGLGNWPYNATNSPSCHFCHFAFFRTMIHH